MKNILKTVSRFLLLGLTAGCGFFALQGNNQSYAPTYADDEPAAKQYSAEDFADEEQASSGELAVSIVESTTTSTSQSLNVSFKTITLEGFKTARGNYIVSITDPNYTGKASEPVAEGYDRLDEETGLPILDGVVSFVLGSSSATNQKVRLPSTLTRDGSFIINVKAKNLTTCNNWIMIREYDVLQKLEVGRNRGLEEESYLIFSHPVHMHYYIIILQEHH